MGKTTCAAIEALGAARTHRTLLVTTDPASTLSAVLQTPVGTAPAPVRGAPRLFAANLDAAKAFQRWLTPRRELIGTIALRGTYLDEEDVARLLKLSLPGIDEVVGLLEVVRRAEQFERVVVDTAPTGHTLRLLSSPALMRRVAGVLDVLQSHHRAVVSALRGSYDVDASDALIEEIARDGEALASLLCDGERSEFCWVTLPEPAALEETSDALAALETAGVRVSRLIVNRVTAAAADRCAWCNARRTFELRAMAPVAARFGNMRIDALPDFVAEPKGPAALRKAARSLSSWHRSEVPPPLAHRVQVMLARRGRMPAAFNELVGDVRWLLFGGKGGVGKSTCAAAAALELAASTPERRVLLLSTDPAHSLGDIFGVRLSDEPRSIPAAPRNLLVREIDAVAGLSAFREQYIAAVDAAFSRISRPGGEDHATFRQLIDLAPPGIDEVIAIAEVAAALSVSGDGAPDLIVTDTAPTGHALRLLQTPAVLREWTQALMAILLKYRELVGATSLAELLVRLSQRLRRLQEVLGDRELTRFIVVTRAASVPVAQTLELMAALRELGIAIAAVIVNAAGAGTCARCAASDAAQRRAIAELPHRCVIIEAPAEMPPPHGAQALARWGAAWHRIA